MDEDDAQREVPLPGGHTTPVVVRVGDTVHRSPTPNAEFVARLLTHLEEAGARVAPRYLGRDLQGREVLEFIPGRTTDHPSQRDEGAYAAGGRLLRRLHDSTAGHPLAGTHECVVHGDPGPYNTIFRDGLPTTLIDWDSARPGPRSWDLGYAGWTWCIQSQGHVPLPDQARRLRALRDGYGSTDTDVLLAQIENCQTHIRSPHTSSWPAPASLRTSTTTTVGRPPGPKPTSTCSAPTAKRSSTPWPRGRLQAWLAVTELGVGVGGRERDPYLIHDNVPYRELDR